MPVLVRRVAAALALLLLLVATPSAAGTKVTTENDLKAAFLFHFTQFVEWPPEALPHKSTPFTIGILGEDPFGKSLDEIVANESVGGHRLVVRRYQALSQADTCHILFISPSQGKRLESTLAALAHRSILTVGDSKDFAMRSGIIGFVASGKRLRLAINLAAARAAGLRISSKLLRQSQIVGPAQVP